jgi:cytochrome b pre-mRNA-processing protein 3
MIFAQWRKRRSNRLLIDQLHGKIVAAARRPALYAELGAPDTFEGRFELMALHAGLVMRALGRLPDFGAELAQELADSVFRHFDIALREIGISDVGMAKRIKRLAEAFYGRNKAYGEALDAADAGQLARALERNVYGGAASGKAAALASYVRECDRALGMVPLQTFAAGEVVFPEIERASGGSQ